MLDHDCCNLLIMADHVQLLLPHEGTEFCCIYGTLYAMCTCVSWIVTGYESAMADTYHITAAVLSERNRSGISTIAR